jgi:hypothetical protein
MALDVRTIDNGLIAVTRDGKDYVGIDTGIPSNSPSLRKLAGQKRQSGWIIVGQAVEEWRALGFVEHAGTVHVYGTYLEGRRLEDALHDESLDRLEMLERIARALAALKLRDVPMFPFHTRAMVLLRGGGILVLPQDIMGAIREHQTYQARIERMERFSHPDRSPDENVGFSLAASAYYIITGEFPYDSGDEEDLHARVRAGIVIPAHHRDVTVRRDVSDALQSELTGSPAATDPAVWADRLRTWRENGVRQDLSPQERTAREDEARQATERLDRTFRRKESVRKNGRKALVIAVIVLVVASIPGTIIRNALRPGATAGLPADEVVEAFYMSINSLDHMTMEDATVDRAGADLIREVTNLFVLDRQRMSVEMESGFVDAQQWRDAGMPTLAAGRMPYGVAGLELRELDAPEGNRRFEARYERWFPDYDDAEMTGRTGIAGINVVDRVSLRPDRRDDWMIYEIERVSQERIDLAALRRGE